MLSVAEIMTREPYTLGPDSSLTSAIDLMREHHIRHIPIVNGNGDVIGLVSHRDVLGASDARVFRKEDTRHETDAVSLASVMSSPVHTVDVSAELRGVAHHLRKQRMGCMPVTENGKLVGIISDSDFLEVAMTLMEQLEFSEPEEDF